MRRRRHLHPDEEDLWHAVARTAKPMHSNVKVVLSRQIEPPAAPESDFKPGAAQRFAAFRLREMAKPKLGHSISYPKAETLAAAPLQMHAKAFGKMTRGKLAPEARIDLHGMTLAEAHPELIHFILGAHSQGLRLVLVITGKGKAKPDHGPIPQRIGALRYQVPQWLRLPPLGPCVLQISEAHLRHGGSGAYYVYLRRGR